MKTFNHVGLDPIELCATMVDGNRLYATPEVDMFPSVTTVINSNAKKKQSIARSVSYTHLTLPTSDLV